MMIIREACAKDVQALMELYLGHLTATPPVEPQNALEWAELLAKLTANPDYHLLVGEIDGEVRSTVTLVVIRNLTHNLRPYAVIENVATHAAFRGRGAATLLMQRATEIAKDCGCYKIMLMTGSKKESTLKFYENCGFNKSDKTAFIKWL